MKWWQRLLANTIIFLALAGFIEGFVIDTWGTALMAAAVFGVLNTIVKPIIVLFSFPITILTMGIFYFVINGLMLWFTSMLVSGFGFSTFMLAVFIALIVSLLNSFLSTNVS